MSGFQLENIIFLAHFKNKNRFPEFPWKMASEQHCVTIHKLLYWQGKKKKTVFLLILHFVLSLQSAFCILYPWTGYQRDFSLRSGHLIPGDLS